MAKGRRKSAVGGNLRQDVTRWENIPILRLNFNGTGDAPTSGQLAVTVPVPDTPENGPLRGSQIQLLVPNRYQWDKEPAAKLVCEASNLLMRAYMLQQTVTLEWITIKNRGPMITRIIATTDLELPPPPPAGGDG